MPKPTGGGLAAAAVAALLVASGALAQETGDRLATVVTARVQLQRDVSEWLTRSLAGAAAPYRYEVAVRAEVRGVIRELRAKQASATPAVKIGGKSRVKLPGLGTVDGGSGTPAMMPEINIEGGTRVTEQVTRTVEPELVRLAVILFVEKTMPQERRDQLKQLATELAGLDRARGDEVEVQERAEWAVPSAGPVSISTLAPPPRTSWAIAAICASAILCASILGWGLSRRAAGHGGSSVAVVGGPDQRGSGDGDDDEAEGGEGTEAEEAARAQVRGFGVLEDATPAELAQILAEADPALAAAILDLRGVPEEVAKLAERNVPPERRVEIAMRLATSAVLTRERLVELEREAVGLLQKIRSRIPVGGPARLAAFLSAASPASRRELLTAVAARDPALARAVRSGMLLFEDLPALAEVSLRQLASEVDPSAMALALVGADAARELVLGAVSQRLRTILEAEDETARARPPAEIDGARATVEQAMRSLHARGLLQLRPKTAAAAA